MTEKNHLMSFSQTLSEDSFYSGFSLPNPRYIAEMTPTTPMIKRQIPNKNQCKNSKIL